MVELTIGSRFYYKGKLCEVAEIENDFECRECVFDKKLSKCKKVKCCLGERHDFKSVFFKEVKE